ncbi:MAG: sulfatase [Bryobacteraceae bacterium]
MTRRSFLARCLAAGGARLRAAPGRLNFVFILADDLGWADTTPYGADLHETPSLERLAREGVRFTRAYAASPVCSPTRASIQTGKHPARLGITIWREAALCGPEKRGVITPQVKADLPHPEVTIAEVLREAGYFTIHIGKWHLGGPEHYPETQGYDVNIGGSLWGAPPTYFWPYRGPFGQDDELRYVPGLDLGSPGEYLTDRLTDEALRMLDAAAGRPFFLNLCYHTVHTPIEGKAELVDRYRRRLAPGLHHRNAAYAAMVRSLDENVGRVLRYLDERGLTGNTVVIFTSDNGGYINAFRGEQVTDNYPLRSGKGSLYEGGIRVPLIVRSPTCTAGRVSQEPVCSTDFYPTMLELAGVPGDPRHNQNVDGLSFARLLQRPEERLARDELYFHYPHYYATTTPVSAILRREGQHEWKLLEYFEDGRAELYDLATDPGETRDLAREFPRVVEKLRERLHGWWKRVGAPLPVPNPGYKKTPG